MAYDNNEDTPPEHREFRNAADEIQRALGRIEGNQYAVKAELVQFRIAQEEHRRSLDLRITGIDEKVHALEQFRNYSSGVVAAILTGMGTFLGIHYKGH